MGTDKNIKLHIVTDIKVNKEISEENHINQTNTRNVRQIHWIKIQYIWFSFLVMHHVVKTFNS